MAELVDDDLKIEPPKRSLYFADRFAKITTRNFINFNSKKNCLYGGKGVVSVQTGSFSHLKFFFFYFKIL